MNNNIEEIVREQARAAKEASRRLAVTSSAVKDAALRAMAEALEENAAKILEANAGDMAAAREKGTPRAMLDRLMLDEKRIHGMADGLRQTAMLPDPIGEGEMETIRPNGLEIRRAEGNVLPVSGHGFDDNVPSCRGIDVLGERKRGTAGSGQKGCQESKYPCFHCANHI